MVYLVLRVIVTWLLKLFYRLEEVADPHHALALRGPVIFVGNHPNGLVDPGLILILAKRKVTFLAKAPLFSIPVLGALIRALGALPVFRKQDDPAQMSGNEGTLAAAVQALTGGRAITLFPEGKSHSEPQLAELKTGCARIALEACRKKADVHIVPVGLNYDEKNRFRSLVRVDVGEPIAASAFLEAPGADAFAAAKVLTDKIAVGLSAVTLNLEKWEDLPLLKTAEALYALKKGEAKSDAQRLRAFAAGMALLRQEQTGRYEELKTQVQAFARRLDLVQVKPHALALDYRPGVVLRFIVRNLFALFVGLPLFVAGMVLFCLPYFIPRWAVKIFKVDIDVEATIKVLLTLLLVPVWWGLLTVLAYIYAGASLALGVCLALLPLALFTRYFLERRVQAVGDARTFLTLVSRAQLKQSLLDEGTALAAQIEQLVNELQPRVA
jgi:1-acyl-sn-glycerol-3-phosphate acyltransferase